jgi:DNA-binding MarR family transcriptional regulator
MVDKSNIFNYSHPEESSGYLLWQLTMLWQRKMKKELDKIDLTHTQFVVLAVLAWLSGNNEIVTQIDIAKHAKTDRMMTSKVLRTLQDKGFIERTEHLTDTRAKSVIITDYGLEIIRKAAQIVDSVDKDFFGTIKRESASFNKSMIELLKANDK